MHTTPYKYGFIYFLKNPIDGIPFYVGKTTCDVKDRLKKHVHKTKHKIKTNKHLDKKDIFIADIISIGLEKKISIEIIEKCEMVDINDREIFWISEYRNLYDLKNTINGGDGGDIRHTKETRKKISANRKGKHSGVDHYNWGRKLGNEPWFKLSELSKSSDNPNIGKKRSAETRNKIGLSNSGENN